MIQIKNVSKTFANGFKALKDVSLTIESGEFFALLGPSGCGKTTLLRMIAGFLYPDKGQIYIDGKDLSDTPPYKRPVNMVFQSYAIFPNMSVYDNIAYGLVIEKMPKEKIKAKVDTLLTLVKMHEFKDSMSNQLSGGQKQRVAIARALAKSPKALLLDEPLAALDAKLRESMRSELIKIQKQSGVTFLFVTHDQSEALSLSNRLAVMQAGEILQIGTPFELYEHPTTVFVADFIGSTNLLDVHIDDNNKLYLKGIPYPIAYIENSFLGSKTNLRLTLRPEKIELIPVGRGNPPDIVVEGIVKDFMFLGEKTLVNVELSSKAVLQVYLSIFELKAFGTITESQRVYCCWEYNDMRILKNETTKN